MNTAKVSVDFRLLSALLSVAIIAMFIVWQPWSAVTATTQTVQTVGQFTITDEPDQFIFMPSYTFTGTDTQTLITRLTDKNAEIVTALKGLGVAEEKITTNANSYAYYPKATDEESTYYLQLSIKVTDSALTQKVQDYLLTTNPSGSITPVKNFSDAKRKVLEDKARDEASKDARKKADQLAANLGFRVLRVQAVTDNYGGGGYPIPYAVDAAAKLEDSSSSSAERSSLPVTPGEDSLTFTVSVSYYIR